MNSSLLLHQIVKNIDEYTKKSEPNGFIPSIILSSTNIPPNIIPSNIKQCSIIIYILAFLAQRDMLDTLTIINIIERYLIFEKHLVLIYDHIIIENYNYDFDVKKVIPDASEFIAKTCIDSNSNSDSDVNMKIKNCIIDGVISSYRLITYTEILNLYNHENNTGRHTINYNCISMLIHKCIDTIYSACIILPDILNTSSYIYTQYNMMYVDNDNLERLINTYIHKWQIMLMASSSRMITNACLKHNKIKQLITLSEEIIGKINKISTILDNAMNNSIINYDCYNRTIMIPFIFMCERELNIDNNIMTEYLLSIKKYLDKSKKEFPIKVSRTNRDIGLMCNALFISSIDTTTDIMITMLAYSKIFKLGRTEYTIYKHSSNYDILHDYTTIKFKQNIIYIINIFNNMIIDKQLSNNNKYIKLMIEKYDHTTNIIPLICIFSLMDVITATIIDYELSIKLDINYGIELI